MADKEKYRKTFWGTHIEFLICIFLIVTTLIAYWQVKNHAFVSLDDEIYVTENSYVKKGLTKESIRWAFGFIHTNDTYWQPLTWLSHMLDCQMYGLASGLHHQTNLIIHIINGLFLFYLLRKMTGALWESAFVACLFALHPINVESVAWVAERKNVLSTLFFMLTILSYRYYCKNPIIIRYIVVLILFILGLMAKPTLVTLPFILLLLDYWPLDKFRFGNVSSKGNNSNYYIYSNSKLSERNNKVQVFLFFAFEKVPFFVISLIIVPFMTSSVESIVISTETVPMSLRVSNALVSYAGYLIKMLWPQKLAFFYPYPNMLPVWKIIGSVLLLISISIVVIRHARKRRYLLVGWLWYIGTLIPVSGILQVGLWPAMADRFAYIPLIGIFIIIAWGTTDFLKKLHFRETGLILISIAIIPILITKTWLQVTTWSDSITLNNHAIDINSNNAIAHNNLGEILDKKGRSAEAMKHYKKALAINPNSAFVHNNFGVALTKKDRVDEAIPHYLEALRINPKYLEAHSNLGAALRMRGNYPEAIRHYEKALSFDPSFEDAYYNLGITYYAQGKFDKAVNSYRSVLRINPFHVDAHINLGVVLSGMGRFSDAVRYYKKALILSPKHENVRKELKKVIEHQQEEELIIANIKEELKKKPGNSELHYKLGKQYQMSGEWEAAIYQYQQALIAKPDNINALIGMAVVDAIQGKYEKAITIFKKVIDLHPENPDAYYLLACIFARKKRIEDSIYWLNKSIEKGFNNWNKIKTDKNLENIRNSLYYRELEKKWLSNTTHATK